MMISLDEDALICDLAETYGIYDMYSMPVHLISRLSFGLGDNSRIKRKLAIENGVTPRPMSELLSAIIADRLGIIICQNAGDRKGLPSIYDALLEADKPKKRKTGFDTVEEYEQARANILRRIKENG